ncbi:MAG: preprotein translocase subunit SecG [Clostridiales bacterium]|nr:preprotein translocase subunit SecG [Clostridiales bacterium]
MSSNFIVLSIFYLILCVTLIFIIILQSKRNSGLGSLSGAANNSYWSKNKKNSLDGMLEIWTKIGIFLFMIFSIIMSCVK